MAARKKTTKKATKRTTKTKAKAKSKEMLLVSSKVKMALKNAKVNVGGDALDGLNDILYWYIDQATKRAKNNGRKTVRSHDFLS